MVAVNNLWVCGLGLSCARCARTPRSTHPHHRLSRDMLVVSKGFKVITCTSGIIQVGGPDGLVMVRGMVFGDVISAILFAGFPVDKKLALANTIADPVEAHVNCLGSLLFNCIVDNASGSAVVGLERGRRLFVAEFFECNAVRASRLGVVEEATKFGFSGTGHDIAHDVAENVDGSIG